MLFSSSEIPAQQVDIYIYKRTRETCCCCWVFIVGTRKDVAARAITSSRCPFISEAVVAFCPPLERVSRTNKSDRQGPLIRYSTRSIRPALFSSATLLCKHSSNRLLCHKRNLGLPLISLKKYLFCRRMFL